MKTYKVVITKKSGAVESKKFTMADDESGHPATAFGGSAFRRDDVRAVVVVKNPGRTTTTVMYMDKNADRINWIFPHKSGQD